MAAMDDLEKSLDEIFVKKAPALPKGLKEWIVTYLPIINLVLAALSLIAAYVLWNSARVVNNYADFANSFSRAYGNGDVVSTTGLTLGVWLAIGIIAATAVIYIAAYPALKARKKAGWNYMFYALLINAVYGVVVAFTAYGTIGNIFGSAIGTIIGLYFLFQIRELYLKGNKTEPAKPAAK